MTPNKFNEIAKRLHSLGFMRIRNGVPISTNEDLELIRQVISGVLDEKSATDEDEDEDESGLLLKMLGIK